MRRTNTAQAASSVRSRCRRGDLVVVITCFIVCTITCSIPAQAQSDAPRPAVVTVSPVIGAIVAPELVSVLGGTVAIRSTIEPSFSVETLRFDGDRTALLHLEIAHRSGKFVAGVGIASIPAERETMAVLRLGVETDLGFGVDARAFAIAGDMFISLFVRPCTLKV